MATYRRSLSGSRREPLIADIRLANTNIAHIGRQRGMSADDRMTEVIRWSKVKHAAEQQLAKLPAAEQQGVREGERGGRFYISSTGQKVYIKDNPGAEIHGHMRSQRFVNGLPISVHLAEPKKPV